MNTSISRLCVSAFGPRLTSGLFPDLAKPSSVSGLLFVCFVFLSLNNNEGIKGVPIVKEEGRRIHVGACVEALLSFVFKFHMK